MILVPVYVIVGHTKKSTFLETKGDHFALNPPPPVTVLFTFENVENVGLPLMLKLQSTLTLMEEGLGWVWFQAILSL